MPGKPAIGPSTKLCMSLAGRPGRFGSRFHNRLYELTGIDYIYKAFTTKDLPAAISGVRALGIRGCAISMPFKEAVIPLLDHIEGSAAAIDSVNTIVNDDGWLTGYNTDYSAVLDLLDDAEIAPSTPFLLAGSGGMAKAVVAALRNRGHHSGVIIARNMMTGQALADLYGFDWEASAEGLTAPLIINATPVGMAGGAEAEALAFPTQAIDAAETVFDVVALPIETPLMRAAKEAGRKRISGADVAVLQALEQFVLYTGVHPSEEQVRDAAIYAGSA